jgi:hypothetical protein
MHRLVCALLLLLALSVTASAQTNLEVSPGFVYISGNQGLDGLNAGAAVWFSRRVSVALDYDIAWDSSRLGAFETTSVGLVTIKSRLQDFLLGPRISFPGLLQSKKLKGNALLPFAEVQMGGSILNSTLTERSIGSASSSDAGFSWMFGGGGDIKLSSNSQWFGRIKVDFLRTHFVSAGQSRVRFGLGIAHTFDARQ